MADTAPLPAPDVLGLDPDELATLPVLRGEAAFRSRQIFEGIHRSRWPSWSHFTTLGRELRERLERDTILAHPGSAQTFPSTDGSTRHVLSLADGARIEAVHMPYEDRVTLCLSSQVGCALDCAFCATGRMGYVRNLTAGEIVGQVLALLTAHHHPLDSPVNLVFMGMGEPLHNLEHVMKAFTLLTDPRGMAIPRRRITLSTAGLVPGIQSLGRHAPRPRLALSLNATTDEARSRLMPINRTWGLSALGDAMSAFPLEKGETITVEYVLLAGMNDSPEDGRRLAAFAARFRSKVNLIPFNAHEGSGFQPPPEARIDELCAILAGSGITVAVRRSRGRDVEAACGQLASRPLDRVEPIPRA